MSTDLFRAILALDAYNRGYLPRISGLGSSPIGNAQVIEIELPAGSIEASFYAIAYQIGEGENAERVISYRGTDNLNILNNWNPFASSSPTDISQYVIGAGTPINPITGQLFAGAQLTVDFYKAVVGAGDLFNNNITLTGHSLGGGQAGFIAGLYGLKATIFDNMTFNNAVTAVVSSSSQNVLNSVYNSNQSVPSNYSNITAIAAKDEFLGKLLFKRDEQTPTVRDVDHYSDLGILGPLDLLSTPG